MITQYITALHVIFMVTWFAGLFYMGRLFIYHVEAEQKSELERDILQEQYKIMERRLWYIITWPAMIGTILFGLYLAHLIGAFTQSWFHLKMLFIFGLIFYHMQCGKIRKKFLTPLTESKTLKYRFFNEVPVLFLVGITFTVYLKDLFSGIQAILILIAVGIALSLGIMWYRKKRKKA